MLYRKIPATEYDVCFMIGSDHFGNDGCLFISKRGNKYGLISYKGEIVSEPVLDEIMLYKPKNILLKGCLHKRMIKDMSKWINICFIIAREGDKFKLFNLDNGHLVLDNCISINYLYCSKDGKSDIIEFSKEGVKGYVLWDESIISTSNYEDVNSVMGFIHVKKDGKYGVIRPSGEELFPCIYDNILTSYGGKFTLIKDGKEDVVNAFSRKQSNNHSSYERQTYERYAGSYAQDEMGWSDDDIDTVLDGDPSAYWNID